jgi:diadenosine tetraphosphate (Ap4A) HIT family hydrolase
MDICLFCNIQQDRIINENELAYMIRDGFPVSPYHTLVIPKRHVLSLFDLTSWEIADCIDLLRDEYYKIIEDLDPSVTGFNVGINIGEDAGQSIMHCHIHLIPRRLGDVSNPRGGVRGVLPSKQNY